MAGIWQPIRSGDWVTVERLRSYSLILLGFYLLAIIGWVVASDGLIDRNGSPLGTDFSNVYAAGRLTWEGRPADAYDPPRQAAAEVAVFNGRDVPFYGWHYPPFFLIVAALLALLPYGFALAAWIMVTLLAYLATIRAIIPQPNALLLAAAFPAVFVNIGHGQNGFVTTALLGGALHWLNRRPVLAGVLIGLLAYKPQFGVLIPLVLLVTGRWRTIGAATATVCALIAITVALFGTSIWHAFADSGTFSREVVLEAGATGWQKIQTLFSAVRMWGGSVNAAYAAQGTLAAALAITLVWLWRSAAAFELKAAALGLGCLLATPYMLDYDLVATAVPIAFLVRHGLSNGFRKFEISLLALAWIAPLMARGLAQSIDLPLGMLALLALYVITIQRAIADLGGFAASQKAASA